MQTTRRRLLCAGLGFVLVASACSGDDDSTNDSTGTSTTGDATTTTDTTTTSGGTGATTDEPPAPSGDGLALGVITAPPGLLDALGQAQTGAVALAAADVAAAGGVLGGPLSITEAQPDPAGGPEAALTSLVDQGARLIVGPTSSDEARALLPLLPPSDAVVCGASTTAPGLTEVPEAEGRFVRTAFDDEVVTVHTFDRVRERTAHVLGRNSRVTIVARSDSYGASVSRRLAELLGIVGTDVTTIGYEARDVVMAGVAPQVAASSPDLVVLIALEEGPRLANLLFEAGVSPAIMLGLDGLATTRFAERGRPQAPTDLDGVTIVGSTGPLDFITRLLDSGTEQVLYGAQAYDCAIAFALAAEATGSTDPSTVLAALGEVTGGGTLCTTYAACVELLHAGTDIDYDGPSGPIDLGKDGEPGGGRFLTARIRNGAMRVVSDLRIDLDEIRAQAAPRLVGFVGSVQEALTTLEYYTGPIDGVTSDDLRAAIAAFQADQGLEPTGQLDAATMAALQAALGARGALLSTTIMEVQTVLAELGYFTGPIDGRWTNELADAIRALQGDLGIEQTGILDAATLRAIYRAGLVTATPEPGEPPTTEPPVTEPPTTTTLPEPTPPTEPGGTEPEGTEPEGTEPVEQRSIVDVIESTPELRELSFLLARDELADVRATLSDPGATITFFAPSSAAIPDSLADADPDDVADLLRYHIVAQPLDVAALMAGGDTEYETMLDRNGTPATLAVTVDGDDVLLAGTARLEGRLTDLEAGAGWVHVIDEVLPLPD